MKVFLLDDDQAFIDVVRKMLEEEGHTAEFTSDAQKAIDIVSKGDYDFVLVDYRLQETDGTWFMGNVKLPRRTKAILVTGYVNRDMINKMFSLGASGYLIKPFDKGDLLRHLSFFSTPQQPG